MRLSRLWWLVLFLAVPLVLAACREEAAPPPGQTPVAAPKEAVKVGFMYDATGATQLIGVAYKAGFEDAINLVNKKGGIDGHPIQPIFCEHSYEVPKGVECYERMKAEGAVIINTYGTPITQAVIDRCHADKIVCNFPGYGAAAAANGERFPFGFPTAASYWSQAGASVKFILDRWQKEGRPGKPKIAFLYYDNPAGREPLDVLRAIAAREGFELRDYAVPAPGVEMSAQVTDIVQRYRADWVITHLFGRSPSVSIKAFKEAGFPLDRVISFVWGSADADVEAAGGWAVAEGYYGLQFTAIGTDLPVLREIRDMYRAEGKTPPDIMEKSNVYYVRGVAQALMWAEALRQALKNEGWPVTGEKMKRGLESLKGEVGGVVYLNLSARDHEGGGSLRVYQAKGGRWVLAQDWFQGYRDVVESFVYR
jgi:branched-chain amino acid transport system substrate-binding protein